MKNYISVSVSVVLLSLTSVPLPLSAASQPSGLVAGSGAIELSGAFAAMGDLRVPDVPVTSSQELTRDDILVRFANCAAWIITDVFTEEAFQGIWGRTLYRAAFWACAFGNGWPQQIRSSDFIGDPVRIAESVMLAADSDINVGGTISGLYLLDSTLRQMEGNDPFPILRTLNCYSYENLYVAFYQTMTESARSRVSELTQAAVQRSCGVL